MDIKVMVRFPPYCNFVLLHLLIDVLPFFRHTTNSPFTNNPHDPLRDMSTRVLGNGIVLFVGPRNDNGQDILVSQTKNMPHLQSMHGLQPGRQLNKVAPINQREI